MAKTVRPVVLDASVVAKRFIHEPGSEKTTDLLQQIARGKWQPAAPEIVSYELAHVFWKHRALGYSRRQLDLALRELEALNLQSVPLASLSRMHWTSLIVVISPSTMLVMSVSLKL